MISLQATSTAVASIPLWAEWLFGGASAVGLIVTAFTYWKARSASQAAVDTNHKISKVLSLSDFSRLPEMIHQIQELLRQSKHELVKWRLRELHKQLVELSEMPSNRENKRFYNKISLYIKKISGHISGLERYSIEVHEDADIYGNHLILLDDLDKLSEFLIQQVTKIKFDNE